MRKADPSDLMIFARVVEAGSFYGPAGEGHLRVCFGSQSIERISEAMDRLQRFFGSL